MTLLTTLKADCLTARKAKQTAEATLLITLIGDIEIIGKNDGNRLATDEECIKTIKKFVKGNTEIMGLTDAESSSHMTARDENDFLSQYLPEQFTEDELTVIITDIIADNEFTTIRDMGKVMKELKASYDGQYDGGMAGKIAKSVL